MLVLYWDCTYSLYHKTRDPEPLSIQMLESLSTFQTISLICLWVSLIQKDELSAHIDMCTSACCFADNKYGAPLVGPSHRFSQALPDGMARPRIASWPGSASPLARPCLADWPVHTSPVGWVLPCRFARPCLTGLPVCRAPPHRMVGWQGTAC